MYRRRSEPYTNDSAVITSAINPSPVASMCEHLYIHRHGTYMLQMRKFIFHLNNTYDKCGLPQYLQRDGGNKTFSEEGGKWPKGACANICSHLKDFVIAMYNVCMRV